MKVNKDDNTFTNANLKTKFETKPEKQVETIGTDVSFIHN